MLNFKLNFCNNISHTQSERRQYCHWSAIIRCIILLLDVSSSCDSSWVSGILANQSCWNSRSVSTTEISQNMLIMNTSQSELLELTLRLNDWNITKFKMNTRQSEMLRSVSTSAISQNTCRMNNHSHSCHEKSRQIFCTDIFTSGFRFHSSLK